ncbi:hypothetical protein QJS10_CPB17g00085 [Acorus calamus]|uniref:Uncharacterized protein n=1 Tax=Acorus calamus TaxID=4465 RepID=A0AAV9CUQ8_ACOCL|nr:hypothetical protein QJS10_CPB17g00085 [Acorus calamus]
MAQKVQFDVGLILDSGRLVGKMSNTSISMALEDFYESHPDYTTQVVLHGRDSDMDVVGAASADSGLNGLGLDFGSPSAT